MITCRKANINRREIASEVKSVAGACECKMHFRTFTLNAGLNWWIQANTYLILHTLNTFLQNSSPINLGRSEDWSIFFLISKILAPSYFSDRGKPGSKSLGGYCSSNFKIVIFVHENQFVPTPGAWPGGNCWNSNSWNTKKSCMILKLVHSEYLFKHTLGENWCCLSSDLWVANWCELTGWGQKEDRELIAAERCQAVSCRLECGVQCGRLVWLVGRGLGARRCFYDQELGTMPSDNWHTRTTWLTSPVSLLCSWHMRVWWG